MKNQNLRVLFFRLLTGFLRFERFKDMKIQNLKAFNNLRFSCSFNLRLLFTKVQRLEFAEGSKLLNFKRLFFDV